MISWPTKMFSPELFPIGNHTFPTEMCTCFLCVYFVLWTKFCNQHKLNSFEKMLGSTFWRAQILGIQAFLTFFGHGFCAEKSSSFPFSAHHRILAAVQGVSQCVTSSQSSLYLNSPDFDGTLAKMEFQFPDKVNIITIVTISGTHWKLENQRSRNLSTIQSN